GAAAYFATESHSSNGEQELSRRIELFLSDSRNIAAVTGYCNEHIASEGASDGSFGSVPFLPDSLRHRLTPIARFVFCEVLTRFVRWEPALRVHDGAGSARAREWPTDPAAQRSWIARHT